MDLLVLRRPDGSVVAAFGATDADLFEVEAAVWEDADWRGAWRMTIEPRRCVPLDLQVAHVELPWVAYLLVAMLTGVLPWPEVGEARGGAFARPQVRRLPWTALRGSPQKPMEPFLTVGGWSTAAGVDP
jgi:hypothetical protein